MRHSLEYKNTNIRKTVGFIKLDTSYFTITFKLLKSCPRHRPIVRQIHKELLAILNQHYKLVDTTHSKKKVNLFQLSRVSSQKRRLKNE